MSKAKEPYFPNISYMYVRVFSVLVSAVYTLQLSYSSLIFVTYTVVMNLYLMCFFPPHNSSYICVLVSVLISA